MPTQVDETLSPLECLARYGRSHIFEQCLAFVNGAAAAARESSCEDIVGVILPLLSDMQQHEEEALRMAALEQLPGVGVHPLNCVGRHACTCRQPVPS